MAHVARLATVVLLLVLADRVAAGRVSSGDAFAIAALVVAATAVLALTPRWARALGERISRISFGPSGVALELVEATRKAAPSQPTEDVEKRESDVNSVLALRLKIEWKLTYIAKHVLDENGHPTYLTIGSLKYDKLLPEADADVVNRLMTVRDEDIDRLSPAARDEFFAAADKVARKIRASVLNCLVLKLLKAATRRGGKLDGWTVEKLEPGEGRRPDFIVEKGGRSFLVASVFATDKKSKILERAKERLGDDGDRENGYAKRIVALPHRSRSKKNREGEPAVVTTDELVDFLAELAARPSRAGAAS
ncbi:MAG TPA: hypothetical protein VNL97_06860 [Solirubrobacterales bacterium]|nr:hypothetical protein [Solirubrobacterales bacterium]